MLSLWALKKTSVDPKGPMDLRLGTTAIVNIRYNASNLCVSCCLQHHVTNMQYGKHRLDSSAMQALQIQITSLFKQFTAIKVLKKMLV